MFDWNDLKYVLAVARGGTLSQAAGLLKVDQTTVTRRLKMLEGQLQAKLFNRQNNRLVATEVGEKLIAVAESIESQTLNVGEQISGSDQHCVGRVTITSVPMLMNQIISPKINLLLDQHPQLQLELIATAENLEFSRRETDIAVRFQRPADGIAICRKLTDLSYSVYYRKDQAPEALNFIGYSEARHSLPQAGWLAKQNMPMQIFVDDAETALAAVKSGTGKTLLPDLLAEKYPGIEKENQYANVLTREIWLLIHPELRSLKRIRVVCDFLIKSFGN